jgi:NitT/TauT family transport system substrate-binding protein
MKKIIIASFMLLLILISGCATVEKSPETSGEVMKVAKYYWPGQFWIEIADDKGFFEEAGLNVELVDTNEDYYQSLQDTVDGKIDYNNFPLYDLMNYNSQGADLVMIVNNDVSDGSEALVVKKEIVSIADLEGKTIGVSSGFYTEYILDVFLKFSDLNNKVTKVEISEDQNDELAPQKFREGVFDGVLTWEPIVSNVVKEGGNIIWDTSDISGISPNGITVRRSLIEEKPEDVQTFVNVWHKTTNFIKENPDEAFGIIANIYGKSVEEVTAFAQLDKILDLKENKVTFSYSTGFESLHGTARQINDFMKENGITDKDLDSIDFIDSRFIRGVKE